MITDIKGVESFLDDLIVFNETKKKHHKILKVRFQHLLDYDFIIREEKCNLLHLEIKYLAHFVSEQGIRSDSKIEAIAKMPPPSDITSLRSCLGAVNFYPKFVSEMHQLRKPLDALLKKDAKFVWNSESKKSLERFKEVLKSNLFLTHYNLALDIIVAADASQSGIGTCIMQKFPDGSMKPISHASRTLTDAEKGYSQIEKEGLALMFAVTKFHRMILGRKFTLQTDHQPVLRIFG